MMNENHSEGENIAEKTAKSNEWICTKARKIRRSKEIICNLMRNTQMKIRQKNENLCKPNNSEVGCKDFAPW